MNEAATSEGGTTLERVEALGRTPPDWYDATPLDYPETLDLSWPEPAPKPWNNQKNVGQYIWDRINPNPGKWREGVKLMHHLMTVNKDDKRVVLRAMRSLGSMYHNLLQDYARAAFWWRAAGVHRDPGSHPPVVGLRLANCYYQLGDKPMALAFLKRLPSRPYAAIKLLGDMGEVGSGPLARGDILAYRKPGHQFSLRRRCVPRQRPTR